MKCKEPPPYLFPGLQHSCSPPSRSCIPPRPALVPCPRCRGKVRYKARNASRLACLAMILLQYLDIIIIIFLFSPHHLFLLSQATYPTITHHHHPPYTGSRPHIHHPYKNIARPASLPTFVPSHELGSINASLLPSPPLLLLQE